jgi:hypothetical protein
MPAPWGNARNPLLSGLFGVFQDAANNNLSTADVWQNLRQVAGAWSYQRAGVQVPADDDLVQGIGKQILSEQNVGIQNVNRYRGIASDWLSAKNALHDLDPDDQIDGKAIFTPPWATTAGLGVPARYRVRVQWELHPDSETESLTWRAYEVDGPLTSLSDLLGQASDAMGKNPSSDNPLGSYGPFVNDYTLEQI